MFLIDKPYASEFLKETIKNNSIPVVSTKESKSMELFDGTNLISEQEAVEFVKQDNPLIYTNSENAIGWIGKFLPFSDIPQKIELFKDKFKFRELTSTLYPDFFYKKVNIKELDSVDIKSITLPFIIKPTVGFFSMGVHKVTDIKDWNGVKSLIKNEVGELINLYPNEVLDYSSFIIEECINGDEYAIDAYFDVNGDPVILNILEHTFSSDLDVSDRVYTSSKKIIENNLDDFTTFLKEIGDLAKVTNFPCHIELRKDGNGKLLPIEINPMRFGGWCTTADFAHLVYSFNPYLYFYNQQKPNWNEILRDKDGKVYALIVLDNSTGKDGKDIKEFNYEKLLSDFQIPLELRKINHMEFPLFGFLFVETTEKSMELNKILSSDLTEYIDK